MTPADPSAIHGATADIAGARLPGDLASLMPETLFRSKHDVYIPGLPVTRPKPPDSPPETLALHTGGVPEATRSTVVVRKPTVLPFFKRGKQFMVDLSVLTDATADNALNLNSLWLIVGAAMVLLMTPGLAFFYGGMVKAKSVISMMMMSFGAIALVAVLWVLYGFSMSFGLTFQHFVSVAKILRDW